MSVRNSFAAACVALLPVLAHAQEVCFNAIDDDFDGLIDLNDTTDCVCDSQIGGGNGVESIIPNASFEDMDCCPSTYSMLYCAQDWVQATIATSDYFNMCDYFPPWIPTPLPGGGAGVVGGYQTEGYQEYVGACLLQPMLTGESYTMQMSMAAFLADNFSLTTTIPIDFGDVEMIIYGYPSCPTFPVNTFVCPDGFGWVPVGSVIYTPSNAWQTVTITFTPTFDVYAVIIGAPCDLPLEYGTSSDPDQYYPYFLYDNLTMNASSYFGATITDTSYFYLDDYALYGHPDTAATNFQWYYEGVALVGQTDSILNISINDLDTGCYQFYSEVDTACTIAEFCVNPVCVPPVIDNGPFSGCGFVNALFDNGTDTSQVISVTWDFGDGSPTTDDINPSHSYTVPGTYDVSLAVLSDDYCPLDTTYIALVTVSQIPEPFFSADLLEGCVGMTVNFTNLTDTLTGGCAWTFGDGGTSLLCDPSHTYNVADTFDVQLTVTSAAGCVEDTTISQMIIVYDEPQVSFTVDTIEGCTPLLIEFTNNTPANQIGSVEWNLGNGTITDQINPTGLYDIPGVYDVSLLVTHPLGCQGEVTQIGLITAYGHPLVTFTNAPDSGCYPLDVQFTNTTDFHDIGTSFWEFGDGETSTVQDPLHTYTDDGLYTVSLQVISPQNCDGDTTMPDLITVFDHPTAGFVFSPQPTDYFQTYISFFDSSSIDAIQWHWEFGENGVLGSSDLEFPTLHFPDHDMGIYPVMQVVTNVHGCTDTLVRNVVIDGYYSVFVPNAFTPDGDGVNETWGPVVNDQDPSKYALSIYDRWGQVIWASTDHTQRWDGKMGGTELKNGVYIWKLQTRDLISRVDHEYIGHVTLAK